MAMAPGRPNFHLAAAVVSLVLPTLLPYATAVALDLHHPHDAAPSNTTSALGRRPPASPSARRLLGSPSAAAAPSPRAAPSPTRRGHARSATREPYYGVSSFADLHDACLRQNCRADYFHRLATVLYGPRVDGDYDAYCVVRSIEGYAPILPGSWRAAVASAARGSASGGGGACYVEVARMGRDTYRVDCWLAWTCSRKCTTHPDEALAMAINAISTPCGGAGAATSGGVARSAAPSLLLSNAALPLLAVAFLPRPVAAAVILASYLPSLVRAGVFQEAFLMKLNHATCAVYPYDNNTGAVDRARPVPGLREMCLRPLCLDFDLDADEGPLSVANVNAAWHGRWNDPLRIFCAVHSLEGASSSPSIFFPWRNTWRVHLPLADPGAAAPASGDNVCYVELAHMDYTEGYYISCPAGERRHARLSCTELPEEAVASAVWEHRKLTYVDTVGPRCERYMYGATSPLFQGYDYDADL